LFGARNDVEPLSAARRSQPTTRKAEAFAERAFCAAMDPPERSASMVVGHLPLDRIEEPFSGRHPGALMSPHRERERAIERSLALLESLGDAPERGIAQAIMAMTSREQMQQLP